MSGSFIYFVHATQSGLVKIGVSRTPRARLYQLRTASPEKLVCLGLIQGDATVERELHARFASAHRRGEWYEMTPELQAFVSTLETTDFCGGGREFPDSPARRVIVKCGGGSFARGVRTIAKWTGKHRSVIYRWVQPASKGGQDGMIPTQDAHTILQHAAAENLGVAPHDFFFLPEELVRGAA